MARKMFRYNPDPGSLFCLPDPIIQDYRNADLDPKEIFMNPKYWLIIFNIKSLSSNGKKCTKLL
jgi:hypothetical protein